MTLPLLYVKIFSNRHFSIITIARYKYIISQHYSKLRKIEKQGFFYMLFRSSLRYSPKIEKHFHYVSTNQNVLKFSLLSILKVNVFDVGY